MNMEHSFRTARRIAWASLTAAALYFDATSTPAQTVLPPVDQRLAADQADTAQSKQKVAETAPATPLEGNPCATSGCACESPARSGFDWSKVPDLRPIQRPGLFFLPPQGEGYYTAWDCLCGKLRDKAPANLFPYTPPFYNAFFDADFRYLDKPGAEPVDFLDRFKRMHFGACDDWMLSLGGEFRYRLANEIGGTNGRLNGKDNRYDLIRTRVYADLWYQDRFRVYVEYLDAQSFNQDLPPLATDIDRSDLLNAFVDIKVAELDDHPVYTRIGRQEMLYGSQRLISSPDFTNVRRTFEGAKLFWHSDKIDVDGFWVRPVLNYPGRFDSADYNRQFAGLFNTYRPAAGQAVDLYYLYLDNDLPQKLGAAPGGRGGYDLNTFGFRYSGDRKISDLLPGCGGCGGGQDLRGSLLWDVEAAYQFGEFTNRHVVAGMSSTGLGYAFNGLPMQPQAWIYYDYASGTPHLNGQGTFETFNQLFPFGHYYFGWLDEVGRENIHDLNFQLSFFPVHWITMITQYHIFRLDQAQDALSGVTPGYPVNRFSPTGAAGTNVGQELDLLANFQLDRHNTIQVGYSQMFSGDFIKQTGVNTNPEFFYVQYYFRW
jgi:hypothetical protein